MKRPIVVLQVIGEMVLGGAESRIMDLLRHLDPSRVRYDFLVFNLEEQHYDREIEAWGSHIYRLHPRYRIYNAAACRKALKAFFLAHPEIDIVQGHMTSAASLYLPVAKSCGIPCTIAHARSAGVDPGLKGLLTRWLRRNLYQKADVLLACSPEAAVAVYGQVRYDAGVVKIVPNAIDLSQYRPTPEHRRSGALLREQLGLTGKYVVGHVGRFHYAKNHEYLLAVFREILRTREDAHLLLVGDGERMAAVHEEARRLGVEEAVIYVGAQTDPAPYYQAMDVLVFPSRYEGLPGTVVEAQAAGLPCLVSDAVTPLVGTTKLVEFYSLSRDPAQWAREAVALERRVSKVRSDMGRAGNVDDTDTDSFYMGDFDMECSRQLCEAGFDVTAQARMLEDFYEECVTRPESKRRG